MAISDSLDNSEERPAAEPVGRHSHSADHFEGHFEGHAGDNTQTDVDVLIVGGALGGATLACGLVQAGLRVALVEQSAVEPSQLPTEFRAELDIRSTALSLSSINILKSLGLWSHLDPHACPIKEVQVSQSGNFGVLRLAAEEQGYEMLGAVVPNQIYNNCLLQIVESHPGITLYRPATVTELSQDSCQVTVNLSCKDEDSYSEGGSDTRQLTTRLVVAADGARSTLRDLVGVSSRKTDYAQVALLLNARFEKPNNGIAYERFTKEGPLAVLPLTDTHCSVIFTVDPLKGERLLEQGEKAIKVELQENFGFRLGRLLEVGDCKLMPLHLVEAEAPFAGRVLLLGNALRSLHPVAGQGFNLALRDIGALIEELTKNSGQRDAGDPGLLQRYADSRKSDQADTVRMTDGFARLFRGNSAFSHLRAAGLLSLNHIPPLQKLFARKAMGLSSRLPDINTDHTD